MSRVGQANDEVVMRTERSSAERVDAPYIIIIDAKKLRQAGIVRLFEAWAQAFGLNLIAVSPDAPSASGSIDANCEMILLSVGSASVEDPEQLACLKSVHTLIPNARLVVLSDREDSKEICAAFEAGAAGFLPTSIEPSVALQALSFIRSGGSFFPPSALSNCHSGPERPSSAQATTNGMDQSHPAPCQLMNGVSSLTLKQDEVLTLLREGQTNKLIARQLGMSEATVKVHVRQIIRKFGVLNRTQAVIYAMNGSALAHSSVNGHGCRAKRTRLY
jgi:DNA-binding NarL/FixJ family response regulator